MKVPFSTPFEMTTSLPVSEVVSCLRETVADPLIDLSRIKKNPVAGYVRDHSGVIFLRMGFFKNRLNWNRVLDLQFIEVPEGTLLRGQFRLRWQFWVGIAFILVFAIFLTTYVARFWTDLPWMWRYLPHMLAGLSLFLAALPIWWSHGAEPQLEGFLQDVLGLAIPATVDAT